MKYGYARVSTSEQNLSLQLDALNAAGCDDIRSEKISSRISDRPEWKKLRECLRSGDEVVVYKIDRIARSCRELLRIFEDFRFNDIALRSINEPWVDTTSSVGKLMVTIMAGLAEFERDLIRQRANDGRAAAIKRGKKMGRPQILNKQQIALITSSRNNGSSIAELASAFSVGRDTIYRVLKHQP